MKKQWLLMCMTALLAAHTSCATDEMVVETTSLESRNYMEENQVQILTQQARQGDTEAYHALAVRYRDGDGLPQSNLNAISMYSIYCHKTRKDLKTLYEFFEVNHSFKLLIEIMDSPLSNKKTEMKLEQLQQIAPKEAQWIKALRSQSIHTPGALEILKEVENEGCEMAELLQAFYYEEMKDMVNLEQYLIRKAEKYPFLHTKIAETYVQRYDIDNDFTNIQKAIEHYYKADSFGMLSPRKANTLWSMYNYFHQKGLLDIDEAEMERLKRIMKTENE